MQLQSVVFLREGLERLVNSVGVQCILFCPSGAVWEICSTFDVSVSKSNGSGWFKNWTHKGMSQLNASFFPLFHSIQKSVMCSTWIFLTATTLPKP